MAVSLSSAHKEFLCPGLAQDISTTHIVEQVSREVGNSDRRQQLDVGTGALASEAEWNDGVVGQMQPFVVDEILSRPPADDLSRGYGHSILGCCGSPERGRGLPSSRRFFCRC